MSARINDKILEVERFLRELESIAPQAYSDYEDDVKTRAACERYFEKITEALVDLAFLVIKDKALKLPEDDKEAFTVLAQAEIIPADLSEKLREAKGMRNVIAHEYGSVDDKLVFEAITEEIDSDAKSFVKAIRKRYPR